MRAHKLVPGLSAAAFLVVACGGGGYGGGDTGGDGTGGGGNQTGYRVTHLVADTPGALAKYAGEGTPASNTDASLKNPWGLAFNPGTGYGWVANNHTDTSTVYDSGGHNQLTVALPPGMAPTGTVYNGGAGFGGALFVFAGEDGTLASWASGATAQSRFAATDGASYTGLAIAGNTLYAADFANGKIDVFDGNFGKQAAGGFADPDLPAGYAPFNVQTVGNNVYVAYAQQDDAGEEIKGAGLGVIDRYDLAGGSLQRLIGAGGALNAPWAIVIAPANFGAFSGDLLVGNFGDGRINAFDPATGNFVGTLQDGNGTAIVLEDLWGLAFGPGGSQPTNALFFAAGINDEANGLYGRIDCNGGC